MIQGGCMRRVIPAMLCLAIVLAATPARAASITFDSPTFNAGDLFSVTIGIENVTDLYTFSVDLNFDPAVVAPTGATAGTFLGGCCFFAILPGDPGGAPGIVQFIGDTLAGPVAGVSGSGSLALVSFTALASGNPAFALSNPFLLNSTGDPLEAELPSVPEPTALSLMALGLLAARRRLRQRR